MQNGQSYSTGTPELMGNMHLKWILFCVISAELAHGQTAGCGCARNIWFNIMTAPRSWPPVFSQCLLIEKGVGHSRPPQPLPALIWFCAPISGNQSCVDARQSCGEGARRRWATSANSQTSIHPRWVIRKSATVVPFSQRRIEHNCIIAKKYLINNHTRGIHLGNGGTGEDVQVK